jgi:hypothetical protein
MEDIVQAYPFDIVDILIVNRREALDVSSQLGGENEFISEESLIKELFSMLPGLKVCVCTLAEFGSIFVCLVLFTSRESGRVMLLLLVALTLKRLSE